MNGFLTFTGAPLSREALFLDLHREKSNLGAKQ